jgi:HAD superfamily hydrolase (TIGR01490 family)
VVSEAPVPDAEAAADVLPAALHPREIAAYRPGPGAAAFFDLDRTLISGASVYVFAKAALKKGLVPKARLLQDSWRAASFKLFGATDEQADAIRAKLLGAVVGVQQSDMLALSSETVPDLLAKVRPEALDLVEWHRRAGRQTFIVSASAQELVEPLAAALGMTGGIGTVSEVVDGAYTGRLVGPFCYGPGKAVAIRELADWEGLDLARCYAYSDSASDLPMLEVVGHPVAVNPDGPLARTAEERGWPVVRFHRRTRKVVRRTSLAMGAAAVAGGAFAAGLKAGRAGLGVAVHVGSRR